MKTSKRIATRKLPCCGKEIDAVTGIGEGKRDTPNPGDFTLCLYCGAWLRFTVELEARMFEAEDILDLEAEQISMMRKATRLIREGRSP